MRLDAGCELTYETEFYTPVILMLRPRSGEGQWVVREEYLLDPNVPVIEYTDSYGNLCQRVTIPPGIFQIKAAACVETADNVDIEPDAMFMSVDLLPDSTLQFLLPSRYCQSDQMGQLALDIVGDRSPGYAQVDAIQQWIHQNVKYAYETSTSSTSAADIATDRIGVCRDFAHLGIALCRSLNIPARMVVGYLYQLDPMDLHAWFEAYLSDSQHQGRWYTFDATQAKLRGNRITIAYGRDAADVALATQFGAIQLTQMRVWVEPATQ
jgi:transglutaminase-like putative cysteine protease